MPLPPEYEQYLRANLNLIERATAVFSGLDERIDYTNILLTKLLQTQGGIAPTQPDWVDNLLNSLDKLTSALAHLNLGIAGAVPNKKSFITGQRTVDTAGTAVQLTTTPIQVSDGFSLTVIAKPANTGYIYVGREKTDAEGSQAFNGLSAGLAISLKIDRADKVWVTSSVAGEGVSWVVERD